MSKFLIRQGNRTNYFFKKYYCESIEDLPKDESICQGSIAFVEESQKYYILTEDRTWIPLLK